MSIVKKEHQQTGQLTHGIVQEILTNSANHPRGIKVRLESGMVGRVQAINSTGAPIDTPEETHQNPSNTEKKRNHKNNRKGGNRPRSDKPRRSNRSDDPDEDYTPRKPATLADFLPF